MKLKAFKLPSELGLFEVEMAAALTPLPPVFQDQSGEVLLSCLVANDTPFVFRVHVLELDSDVPVMGQVIFLGHAEGRYYFIEQNKVQVARSLQS